MDKNTLSHYGWIVVLILILSVLLALATPFGNFVARGFKATYVGISMGDYDGLGNVIEDMGGNGNHTAEPIDPTEPEIDTEPGEGVEIKPDNSLVLIDSNNNGYLFVEGKEFFICSHKLNSEKELQTAMEAGEVFVYTNTKGSMTMLSDGWKITTATGIFISHNDGTATYTQNDGETVSGYAYTKK